MTTIPTSALIYRKRPAKGKLSDELHWEQDTHNGNSEKKKDSSLVPVRVACAGLNVDDIHLAEGTMILPISPKVDPIQGVIPGMELAGTRLNTNINDEKAPNGAIPNHTHTTTATVVGIKPCIYQTRGTWTTTCYMKEAWLAPAPPHLSLREAAAIPITACAALANLRAAGLVVDPHGVAPATITTHATTGSINNQDEHDDNKPSVVAVVVGASGGIGTMLTQMLVRTQGHVHVIAVSSKKSRHVCCDQCGAHEWVDRNDSQAIQQLVRNTVASRNCRAVFDLVGGRDLEQTYYRALSSSEAVYCTMNGPLKWIGDDRPTLWTILKYMLALFWRVLTWGRLFRGAKYVKVDVPPTDDVGDHLRDAMKLVTQYKLRPVVDSVVSGGTDDDKDLNAFRAALDKVRNHQVRGKVVLRFQSAKKQS